MSKKFGVVGVVAALLLAFAAFGLQSSEKAAAVAGSITAGTTAIQAGSSTTISANYVDDTGAAGSAVLTVAPATGSLATGTLSACSVTVNSDGQTVTTCAATSDADTVAEATTLSATLTCGTTLGGLVLTLTEGGTSVTLAVTCGQGLVGSVTVETKDGTTTGAPLTTLETNSVSSSTPSEVDIAINVKNSAGVGVDGVEVLGLATIGILESSGNISTTTTGGVTTCKNATTDATPLQEEVNSSSQTVAYVSSTASSYSVFTYCASSLPASGSTTLTFIIVSDLAAEADIILTQTLTIVGPPVTVTIDAAPKTLICGEKATLSGTVKDANGANVSNGTAVTLITNYGGVGIVGAGIVTGGGIGGTFASTTTSGAFSGFLLTSTQNVGPYEVVVAVTGASGATLYAQTTVTCTAAVVAAPTVSAPSTGTAAVRPPSTGDAGLATESSSWASFALAGLVAFAIAGLATVKFARR